jgi:hypothetical protein
MGYAKSVDSRFLIVKF